MVEPTPTPPPPQTPSSSPAVVIPNGPGSGLPQNIAAGLACIFPIIGGIIFLILDRANRFVRFHALQSIYLGVLILAISLVFRIAIFIFSQVPFIGTVINAVLGFVHLVLSLIWFVVFLITIVQAFRNKEWAVPYIGGLVRRQMGPAAV